MVEDPGSNQGGIEVAHHHRAHRNTAHDVSQIEWNRYASICGAVDEEISAPELVKAKNLCPHQDFIYFCVPTAQERLELEKFNRSIAAVLADAALNEAFIQAVQQHPVLENPADHIDELLGDSDYYSEPGGVSETCQRCRA